jgi:hypothetical protein
MRKMLWTLPAVLLLASCQTWGPTWSEVTGQRWTIPPKEFNTVPTFVNKIDGSSAYVSTPGQGIRVEPGPHALELAAPALSPGWTGGTDLVTMKLDFAPCKRYYINGRYSNPLGPNWSAFVDYEETIAGCTVTAAK